ncbi:hypothetical protein G647_04390 [Cladophialophora carrionii CBS 160.54]|uniref:BTB domain-containing protein n=1 Tax=Cladophialophora carrionii CBS 160.54 TaxID=1279043 RepID=V9DDV0_9EURO|nr:uncharacterized protein G647_04390 [Cladophialophora carrionii CBS 160.54]ETI25020.1 hypothetical protein G647_04390 [Cladophialophora carrionii CBS 160.54]
MDGSEVALAPAESKPPTKVTHQYVETALRNRGSSHVANTTVSFAALPIITVSVGKEQITYQTHKDILTEKCRFFANMFDSGMSEAHTNHVKLPEDSHEAFEQFLSWIYFDEPPPQVDDDNLPCALPCWVLADKFGMAKWQDNIISEIMAWWHGADISARDILWTLENASSTSVLFRLVVDQFVYQAGTTSEEFLNTKANRKELEYVLLRDELPLVDFIVDLTSACKGNMREPSGQGCKYHVHDADTKCQVRS